MAGPANISEVVNRLTGGNNGTPETAMWWKDSSAGSSVAGYPYSYWAIKGQPCAGATPGVAAVCTSALAGAMRLTNPGGGRKRWLRNMALIGWTSNRYVLYDRLVHCGGLSGTVTTAQSVGVSVTRYTGAESFGNLIMAECYATIGATQTTFTCSYLDSTGTTRTTLPAAIGGSTARNPGNAVFARFDPAIAGSNSVTQVVSTTLAATTGSAGNWGITILRPLAEVVIGAVDISAFGHGTRTVILEDVEIKTDACLAMLHQGSATTSQYSRCMITSVEN